MGQGFTLNLKEESKKVKKFCRKNSEIIYHSFAQPITTLHNNEVMEEHRSYEILITNMPNPLTKCMDTMLRLYRFKHKKWINNRKTNYIITIPCTFGRKKIIFFSRFFGIENHRLSSQEVSLKETDLVTKDFRENINPDRVEVKKTSIEHYVMRFREYPEYLDLSLPEFSKIISKTENGKKFKLRTWDIVYALNYAKSKSFREAQRNILKECGRKIKLNYLKQTIVRVCHFIEAEYDAIISKYV